MVDMSQAQPQPIPPNTMLRVTLEAQEWNIVFAGLGELQLKLSRPVFDKVMEQVQTEARLAGRPNGDARDMEALREPPYRRDMLPS